MRSKWANWCFRSSRKCWWYMMVYLGLQLGISRYNEKIQRKACAYCNLLPTNKNPGNQLGLVVSHRSWLSYASGFYPMVRSRLCHWLIGFSWGLGNPTKKIGSKCRIPGNPGFLGVWAKEFNKKTVIQMWLMAFRELSSTSRNLDLLKVDFFFAGIPEISQT